MKVKQLKTGTIISRVYTENQKKLTIKSSLYFPEEEGKNKKTERHSAEVGDNTMLYRVEWLTVESVAVIRDIQSSV